MKTVPRLDLSKALLVALVTAILEACDATPFEAVPEATTTTTSSDSTTSTSTAATSTESGGSFTGCATSGALDVTFNSTDSNPGYYTFSSSTYQIFDIASDSSERIYVLSQYNSDGAGAYDFRVCRLTSAGALDSTYGTSGCTSIDFGTSNDYPNRIAIDSSGRAVVVGIPFQGSGGSGGGRSQDRQRRIG